MKTDLNIDHKRRILFRAIDNIDKLLLLSIIIALQTFIFWLDYITGPLASFTLFYLLPIGLAAVYLRPYWAYLVSLIASVQGIFIFLQLLPVVNLYLILLDFVSKAAIFFLITFLILQLRKLLDDFAEQASTDYLTGTNNRRYFYEICSTELARAWRYQQPLSLVFIDIDDFKYINDIHGHQMGDQVLVDTVATIRADLREGDLLGRIGGDEFAIMLHQADQEQAKLIIERIKEHLAALKTVGAQPITYSIGVATYSAERQISFDALIATADQAMYTAKDSSKNTIEFVSV